MKTVAILSLFIISLLFAQPAKVTQHFNVVTTTVKKERVTLRKEFYGYVAADEARIYDVVPRFGGYVEELRVGARYLHVRRSEKLAKVYSPDVYKAKEELLRSYSYAKGDRKNAMVRSAITKLKLLGVTKGEIAQLLKHKKVDETTTLYAPQSGYIFQKRINEGSR